MTVSTSINTLRRAALALALLPLLLAAGPAPKAEVKLWRLDCGSNFVADLNNFSDTRAYSGQSRQLVASCYLIRHGDQYMLWDTGFGRSLLGKAVPAGQSGATLRVAIVDQLKDLGVTPEQISFIGISHYHGDHIGQAADFPQAKLMIGEGDLEVVKSNAQAGAALAPWIAGKSPVEGVKGDKDVFGDGSVTMLDLPGHTPGHHGLLVKLDHTGWVLLSGDVAHFRENLESDGVPGFNVDRSKSLASMDRFKRLGANLKAVVIIQHDPRDVPKLPQFPKAAD
jgi:glyoxylase-like metal-dependent hydrolase (beta-lactamase superfamily II)